MQDLFLLQVDIFDPKLSSKQLQQNHKLLIVDYGIKVNPSFEEALNKQEKSIDEM